MLPKCFWNACACTRTHIHTHTHTHMQTDTSLPACACIRAYAHIHTYTHADTHACIHTSLPDLGVRHSICAVQALLELEHVLIRKQGGGGSNELAKLDVRGAQLLKQPVRGSVLLVRGLLGKCREGEEAMNWPSLMYLKFSFSNSLYEKVCCWYVDCLASAEKGRRQ